MGLASREDQQKPGGSVVCCSTAKLCLTLRSQGLQQVRLPYPSASPGVCSGACLLCLWCHPSISFLSRPFSPPVLNAEADAPILWPPDAKSWLTGKDPDAGKGWGGSKETEILVLLPQISPCGVQRLLVSLKSYSCKIILSIPPSMALGSDNSPQITHWVCPQP